jgi:hypothetical protein
MDKIVELQIAAWLACAAFLLMFARNATALWRELKGKEPHPPNDTLEAGRKELERRVTEVEKETADIRRGASHDREAAEVSARNRSAGIYNKMEEVRKELTGQVQVLREEVGKQFKDTERALGRIEGKLDPRL